MMMAQAEILEEIEDIEHDLVSAEGLKRTVQQDTTLWCWVGTSNTGAATGYPAVRTNCSITNVTVCQQTYIAISRVFEGSCVNRTVCEALRNDTLNNAIDPEYELVNCCNTSDCNSHFLENGSFKLGTAMSFVVSFGFVLISGFL